MTNSVSLGTDSIVANRFVFEEQIGRGGMGTVFKARDRRKEEACDPNPRVAIKILNEEFKRHPNAVQALQREARKAQGIAHPNIVQVYDFDRDGSEVFMVMELLEGRSLDRVIKEADGTGVGFKEAFRIISSVCDAMAYAHERGIVHADFKPANVFMTRQGVVKVLDFGIAQAVKLGDVSYGSDTVFNPGDLGALTPAYAGYEVIEGQPPDIRDDIYAIACVFYELLTGKHPFNRYSAEDASKANLVAARPRGLSRAQWQVLRSALEFRRDPRPASATALIEGLRPKRIAPKLLFGLAAAASAVIVAMLSTVHFMSNHDDAIRAALISQDATQIESVMPWLKELTPERRATIFLDDTTRSGLIGYFKQRVDEAVDPEHGQYDYARADVLTKELWELLPDSRAVKKLVDRVSARRSYALQRDSFAPKLIEMTASGPWMPDTKLKQWSATLKNVSRTPAPASAYDQDWNSLRAEVSANANSAALLAASAHVVTSISPEELSQLAASSPKPEAESKPTSAVAYLRLASTAVKEGRIEEALNLADSGLKLSPKSPQALAARDRYARYVEINDYLLQRERILMPHIRYKIWRVSKLAPDEMPAVTQRWRSDLANRILATEDPKLVAHLSQASLAIFGSDAGEQPEPVKQVAVEARPQG